MIITQSPYRVSFAGGGTDLPAFWREERGAVLSVAIRRHMYTTVSPRFEPTIRVAYSRTEVVDRVDDLQHTIVREALRQTGIARSIEITTIGDVPAGTGLGSSSSLTVGLLQALYAFTGKLVSRETLGREACEIEIDRLQKPIGKQDQYAAAFGGLNYIGFHPDGTVTVEPVPCKRKTLVSLQESVLLFYTNQSRDADVILDRQSRSTDDSRGTLRQMRDLADAMRQALAGDGDLNLFGGLLHEGWLLKQSLDPGISNSLVDGWYSAARAAGAQAGKLLGAGGGGFLLILAPPERHDAIRHALGGPRELEFAIDPLGSRIIFLSEQHG